MEPTGVVLLLLLFLTPGLGAPLEDYVRTQGALLFNLTKQQLEASSFKDCASRCEEETGFTCRSFQLHSKEQRCVITAENSKMAPVIGMKDVILLEKIVYLTDCMAGNGRTYRGTVSTTKSGLTCQNWNATFPHRPNFSLDEHPFEGLEENYCRNPDDDKKGPWCYTLDPDVRYEYCDIPQCEVYVSGCKTGNGRTYRGTVSMTKSGLTCQRWSDSSPHKPNISPDKYPFEGLEENYCRNPDDDEKGPWCYTLDPDVRYDYCDIPQCEVYVSGCKTGNGRTYRGTMSMTKSGLACQRWSDSSPHKPNFYPEKYPSEGLEENYCRNPDGDAEGPWCYTLDPDVRFEYCNIPQCEDSFFLSFQARSSPMCNEANGECTFERSQKGCLTGNGRTYRGTVSTTKSGLTCQKWSDSSPHRPKYSPTNYPSAGLEENYCRNPDDDEKGPWCYTLDPDVRFEYCNIPPCEGYISECMTGNGRTYRGTVSTTKSGLTCQKWGDDSPHRPNYSPGEYPSEGLEENYCRNPDDDEKGPWCYTLDPDVRYEYCDIPPCEDLDLLPLRAPQMAKCNEADGECAAGKSSKGCKYGNGRTYRGTMSTTKSGLICQKWGDHFPHRPKFSPEKYPSAGLEENYCRNPDNDSKGPWCYTLHPHVRYDYCDIPSCEGQE